MVSITSTVVGTELHGELKYTRMTTHTVPFALEESRATVKSKVSLIDISILSGFQVRTDQQRCLLRNKM